MTGTSTTIRAVTAAAILELRAFLERQHVTTVVVEATGNELVADVIAETGTDMSVFPSAVHLASWAGVCPGSKESAGRVKSSHIRRATITSKLPSASQP